MFFLVPGLPLGRVLVCSRGAVGSEIKTMIGFFLKNINIDGQGGVCASPSTSQPDYFYHWQRDSAISMREYMHTHNLSEYLADMQVCVAVCGSLAVGVTPCAALSARCCLSLHTVVRPVGAEGAV